MTLNGVTTIDASYLCGSWPCTYVKLSTVCVYPSCVSCIVINWCGAKVFVLCAENFQQWKWMHTIALIALSLSYCLMR